VSCSPPPSSTCLLSETADVVYLLQPLHLSATHSNQQHHLKELTPHDVSEVNGASMTLFALTMGRTSFCYQQGLSKAVSDGSWDQRGTSAFSLFLVVLRPIYCWNGVPGARFKAHVSRPLASAVLSPLLNSFVHDSR
jgi:hypothetical protein